MAPVFPAGAKVRSPKATNPRVNPNSSFLFFSFLAFGFLLPEARKTRGRRRRAADCVLSEPLKKKGQ